MRLSAAALLFALAASPAAAQPPPGDSSPAQPVDANAAIDLGSSVVEALEVVAQPPGPALWKVAKGDSEVVVLGAISPLPHSLAWDTGRVDRALDGATVMLDLLPKPKFNALDMLKFAVTGQSKIHNAGNRPLEDGLPTALRERFVGARTAAHKDAARYAKWKPFVASVALVNDYRAAAGLSSAKPGSTLKKLASARRVPIRTPLEYRVLPLVGEAAGLSDAAGLACLGDAVDQVQLESDHAQAAAKAWAAGDLKGVRANYAEPPLQKCLQQVPSGPAMIERGTADSARAIAEALRKPGKSVAVVDMNFLLRPNGVLDRLKAQGATVTVPPG